ncbi:MAG: hypothetical protein AAGA02_13265, partial [Bacteroidota bacterium]
MKKLRILVSLLVLCSGNSVGQDFIEVRALSTELSELVSTDKKGNIYVSLANGAINQYNTDGDLLNHYSPVKPSEAALIEAWNPLKIFVFYRDFQEYVFLDRFLTTASRFSFAEISSYIGLATMSADNNLWLIDYSEFSLKKYDVNLQQVTIERPLDLVLDPDEYDLTFMREYQNLLFLADRNKGVLMFDNLGNYLRLLSTDQLDYFSFTKNELYFVKNQSLSFIDIYTGKMRSVDLPKS